MTDYEKDHERRWRDAAAEIVAKSHWKENADNPDQVMREMIYSCLKREFEKGQKV